MYLHNSNYPHIIRLKWENKSINKCEMNRISSPLVHPACISFFPPLACSHPRSLPCFNPHTPPPPTYNNMHRTFIVYSTAAAAAFSICDHTFFTQSRRAKKKNYYCINVCICMQASMHTLFWVLCCAAKERERERGRGKVVQKRFNCKK
jgi:hypothetical protein